MICLLFLIGVYFCKPDLSIYDLSSITSPTNYTYTTPENSYIFNFRKILADACYGSTCIATVSGAVCFCYGLLGSEEYDFTNDDTGLAFKYSIIEGHVRRITNMNLYCTTGEITYVPYLRFHFFIYLVQRL
jgi:hypothetical protein